MSKSVNKVILVGRLGVDPDVRYAANGNAVCNFTVATNDQWRDKTGEKQDRPEWHRCVAFGKLGELCGQMLNKGKLVYLEGRNQTRKWTDKEGIERYTMEVVINEMIDLTGRTEHDAQPPAASGAAGDGFDEIPF